MCRLIGVFAAIVVFAAGMSACGGDASDHGLEDVTTGDDAVESDSQESQDSQDETLQCGPGTVELDGQCVIDEGAAQDLLKADVAGVTVTSLLIAEEGVRAVYPMHALHASITLDVETWDELDTTVVLGLESADGSTRCVAGYWGLISGARLDSDDADPVQSLTLTSEFYVQPACSVLEGETDVKAWVSFDPFDHTKVEGRTINADETMTLTDFLQQSRLPLTDCTCASLIHPETCETALEVQGSPGRDVVMESSTLSSTVAVLEIPRLVPEYTDDSFEDDEGNIIELAQPDEVRQLSTAPHFIVNADIKVNGLDGSEDDVVEDAALSLRFAIRPLLDSNEDVDLPEELLDWMSLYSEIQDEPKAGEEPTINLLEQEFLQSMVGAQSLVRTSPIFITGDAEMFITRGLWSGFDQFELRVCVDADFDEAGVDEDATENNCSITQVIVLRRDVDENPAADEDAGAANYKDGIFLGQTYGNTKKVAVQFALNGELLSTKDGVAAGALLGTYLKGWFAMTLFEVKRHGWDYYDASTDDEILSSLTIFGLEMPAPSEDFPVGDSELPEISFTQASPSVRFGFDLGVVFVGVEAHAEGTIGVGAYLIREAFPGAITNPRCLVPGAVTEGNFCVRVFDDAMSREDADEACRNDEGWLAAAYSPSVRDAILQARTAAGVTSPYLWVDGAAMAGSCTTMGPILEDNCEQVLETMWYMYPQQYQDKFFANCMEHREMMLQVCAANRADLNQWRWSMPTSGSVANSGVPFSAGQPNDAAPGEAWLSLKSTGKFFDVAEGALMPYVCQYPLTYTAGGRVSATVEPFATLTLVGSAGVSIVVAGADLWVAVDLLTAALPLTGSVRWLGGGNGLPTLTLATGTLDFVLRGLGGEIGATVWAQFLGSWSVTIFGWDSIEYGRWTLGSLLPRWRSQ